MNEVVSLYSQGVHIDIIAKRCNLSKEEISITLLKYKQENKNGNTFSDEFRTLIAERDKEGVSRNSIARELKINPNTVRRACREFGDAIKARISAEDQFIEMKGLFSIDSCPDCKSKRVNQVEDNNIYCMSCGNEYVFKNDSSDTIFKVVWDNID